MYIELEDARQIIQKRWRDLEVRRRVREYVGKIPAFLRNGPRAVLARQMASPNFECIRFAAVAGRIGLKAVCPEYTRDRFSTRNPDKRRLGKMTFFKGRGRKGGIKTITHRIIDFNLSDGKALEDARTLWDEHFTDFHHRLLATRLPGVEITDNSMWLKEMGGEPALFWPRLMALFICHGILFDNFHATGQEESFTRDIIRPALRETEERFGLKPLVVPLVPPSREQEPYWSWYPDCFEKEVRYLINQPENGLTERRLQQVSA